MAKEFTVLDETVLAIEDFIYDNFYDYEKVFDGIEIYEDMQGGVVIEIYNRNLGVDLYELFYNEGFEVIADKDY